MWGITERIDPEKFGKQVGGDILANKKTFMLIKAKELAQGDLEEDLNHWLSANSYNSKDKIKAITSIYDDLEVRKLAEIKMEGFARKALTIRPIQTNLTGYGPKNNRFSGRCSHRNKRAFEGFNGADTAKLGC